MHAVRAFGFRIEKTDAGRHNFNRLAAIGVGVEMPGCSHKTGIVIRLVVSMISVKPVMPSLPGQINIEQVLYGAGHFIAGISRLDNKQISLRKVIGCSRGRSVYGGITIKLKFPNFSGA